MREIKFRAWDKVNKKFREDFSILIDREGSILDNKKDDYVNDDYVIQQFTGLKDKNGKEIYEGDIVKGIKSEQEKNSLSYEIKSSVYFRAGGFELFGKNMQDFTWIDDHKIRDIYWVEYGSMNKNLYWKIIDIEILGNLYKSPELLEGKE